MIRRQSIPSKKEIADVRSMGVWDDASVSEFEELKSYARASGEEMHFAEVMEIGSIKHDELGPSLSQHKGRLVFRGDVTKNQDGLPAKFRELHSQPASILTIHLVRFYGVINNHMVSIADARKAYLQASLRSTIPTWIRLPKLCLLPEWEGKYKVPTVRLLRPLYGHPEAGKDWHAFFAETVQSMGLVSIENFPSLWWCPSRRILVATYVDDIICSGVPSSVDQFWTDLRRTIQIEAVEEPGRYLGRNHHIQRGKDGNSIFMSMKDYCVSAIELYLQHVGNVALKSVATPYLSDAELNVSDWESKGALGERSASILMKVLWLARLSRPDLSHAVTKLASGITRWTVNHDKLLHRMMCYMQSAVEFGFHGSVKGGPEDISLHLYTDADLGGDVLTMKSHTGIYLCVECPHGTHFPLSWASRRQQCVSEYQNQQRSLSL